MFKGYDRYIVVLDGKGMTLDVADRGLFDLAPFQPFSFSGDAKVTGLLKRGAVTDFNLMVHRDFGEGKLRVQVCNEPYGVGGAQSQHLVHQLGADSYVLEAGENFVFPANATLVICEVIPRWRPEPAA
jgi:environmental stress-induced protein Ves